METSSIPRIAPFLIGAVVIILIFAKLLPFQDVKRQILVSKSTTRAEALWAMGLLMLVLVIGTLLLYLISISKITDSQNRREIFGIEGAIGQFVVCFVLCRTGSCLKRWFLEQPCRVS